MPSILSCGELAPGLFPLLRTQRRVRSLFDSAHLENRRAGLEAYLQAIVNTSQFQCPALAMFLDLNLEQLALSSTDLPPWLAKTTVRKG